MTSKKEKSIIVEMNKHVKKACSNEVKVKKISDIDNVLLKCSSHHDIVQACSNARLTEQETIDMLIKHSNQCRTLIASVMQAKIRIKRIMLSIKIANNETSASDTYTRRAIKRAIKINSF